MVGAQEPVAGLEFGDYKQFSFVGAHGDEVFGYLDLDWQQYVEIDSRYFRPAEVDILLGDSAKARQRLGWATAPEFGFDTAYQCATRAHPRSWSCYLRGPSGELLHLHPDSTAQVRLLWQEE